MFLSDSPNSIEEAELGVIVFILKKVKQRLWGVKTRIQSHMTNKCQRWDQKQFESVIWASVRCRGVHMESSGARSRLCMGLSF